MTDASKWIVIADERRASLHCCQMQNGGNWRVETKANLENRWENYHEHHRPSLLGRGPSANASQHFAASEHEPEEEHRRFAKDVVSWLARAVHDLKILRVDIFAASRFLGVFRKEFGHLKHIAETHEAELAHMSPSDLAFHPAVVSVLNSKASARTLNR